MTGPALLAISALFAWGAAAGYNIVNQIASDPVFWDDVKCAVYDAIVADGKITQANWATACTNIGNIAYSVPGAAAALKSFCQGLDFQTVLEWQQLAPLDAADCTDCTGAWCREYSFAAGQNGWTVYPGAYGAYQSGSPGYWYGTTPGVSGLQQCVIRLDLGQNMLITGIEVLYANPDAQGSTDWNACVRDASGNVAQIIYMPGGTWGAESWWKPSGFNATGRYVSVGGQSPGTPGDARIYAVRLRGTGPNPFGADNCTG
jgi:hypothetical protein